MLRGSMSLFKIVAENAGFFTVILFQKLVFTYIEITQWIIILCEPNNQIQD